MDAVRFFNEVARPNIAAAVIDQHDYRLAINAVFAVDATYGILFHQLSETHHTYLSEVPASMPKRGVSDSDLKNHIAKSCPAFEMIRDAAYATKHGRLNSRGRVVISADDVQSLGLVCGLFAVGDPLGGNAVFININAAHPERAWVLLRGVELFTDELFGELGLAPLACPIPAFHEAYRPEIAEGSHISQR